MRSAPAPVAALSGAFDENTRRVGGNSTDRCQPTGSTSCSRRDRSLSLARVPASHPPVMPYSGTFAAAVLPAPFISSIRATTRSRAFPRASPMTSCRPRPMSPSSSCRRPPCRPRSRRRRRRARRSASSSPQGLATAPARLPISAGRLRARQGCALSAPIASACWCRAPSSTRALPPRCRRPAISRLSPSPAPLRRDWSNGRRRRESDFPR